jgi:hypothetical protein
MSLFPYDRESAILFDAPYRDVAEYLTKWGNELGLRKPPE